MTSTTNYETSVVQASGKSALTMSSRDIAELVGTSHDSVLKTIRELTRRGVVSGNETPYQHPQNKQIYSEYRLNRRDTLVVASGYSVELRAKVVDRLEELEAQAKAPALPNFSNPVEAARAWADAKEQELKAKSELALAAPKVEFVDKYVDSTGLLGFRQVCKLLKAKENDFRAFLEDRRVMYRLGGVMTPYAEHINAGRFEVKTGTAANDHSFNSAKFTPKGVEWISKAWRKRSDEAVTLQ